MTYHTPMKTSGDYITGLKEAREIAKNISAAMGVTGGDQEVFAYRWDINDLAHVFPLLNTGKRRDSSLLSHCQTFKRKRCEISWSYTNTDYEINQQFYENCLVSSVKLLKWRNFYFFFVVVLIVRICWKNLYERLWYNLFWHLNMPKAITHAFETSADQDQLAHLAVWAWSALIPIGSMNFFNENHFN